MAQKMKTRKSAVKRFKVTKTGKLLHRVHGSRHVKSKKSNKRNRSLKTLKEIVGKQKAKIKKMMAL